VALFLNESRIVFPPELVFDKCEKSLFLTLVNVHANWKGLFRPLQYYVVKQNLNQAHRILELGLRIQKTIVRACGPEGKTSFDMSVSERPGGGGKSSFSGLRFF
jgi:hypothetical protein